MIKINLLGKKSAQAPFGLDPLLAKLGVTSDDLSTLRPGLLKLLVVGAFLYAGDYIPSYILEQKAHELDVKIKIVLEKNTKLQADLTAKKEIRKQMEQLQKDEADINKQLSAINGLTKDRSLSFRAFENITAIIPPKVWLTRMEYSNRHVTIRGSSWEYFAVNEFVKALNETASFQGVNLSGINASGLQGAPVPGTSEADQKIKDFDIDFSLKSNS